MGKNRGPGPGAFGAILAAGFGVAAGVAIYKNRELLKTFYQELAGDAASGRGGAAAPEAAPEPGPEQEEVNIVIDRSGED